MKEVRKLTTKVSKAKSLEDNKDLYEAVRLIALEKEHLSALLSHVEAAETALKEAVDKRAVELYGDDWEPLESDNYKLLRVSSGAVYVITGEADSRFTKQTVSVDTAKTTKYLTQHGSLPTGIEPNRARGERIVINLK